MDVKPGFKPTEVGVIPRAWGVSAIKQHAVIKTGKRNTQDRVEDGQYPLVILPKSS
jgi:type I restriction enzyme S subunit